MRDLAELPRICEIKSTCRNLTTFTKVIETRPTEKYT